MIEKKFLIVDANSLLHRAFHALPPLTTKKGEPVGAVYGFLLIFFRVIKEFQPDFIAACFDFPAKNFRHLQFEEYKAKRPPLPESLSLQILKTKEVLKMFGAPVFEKQGFEADDIIATLADRSKDAQVIIVSGDSDALSLVNEQVKVFALRKGIKNTVLYDTDLVKEKYQGLAPEQLIDLRALRGDVSDNIPGVKGVGEKTAIKLLLDFGSLENLYQELEKETEETNKLSLKLKDVLLKEKEKAFLSQFLARLQIKVPVDFDLEQCRWKGYDKEKAIDFLKGLEFYSLINRLP